MNPARSLGRAIVSGDLESVWIYLLAPLCGGLLGALVYGYVRGQPGTNDERVEQGAA
jgi:glycerol uptake facilitator-like aquaporin